MSNENQAQRDRPAANLGQPATPTKAAPHKGKGKGRAKSNARIKALIAGLSVAATIGGWGIMAQHDSVSAAQAALEQTSAALVSETTTQQSPDAIATAIATATASATVSPTAIATQQIVTDNGSQPVATATLQATDTPQPVATDTPQPTATAVPTATSPRVITTTRSSR